MPNEAVLEKLAAASTVDDIKSILEETGSKLVYKDEKGPEVPAKDGPPAPFGGKPADDPDAEGDKMTFGDFKKKSLGKAMKAAGGEEDDGGY